MWSQLRPLATLFAPQRPEASAIDQTVLGNRIHLVHPVLFSISAYLSSDAPIYPGPWRWIALISVIAFAAIVYALATLLVRSRWRGALLATVICVTFLNDNELLAMYHRAIGMSPAVAVTKGVSRTPVTVFVTVTWLIAAFTLWRSNRQFPGANAFLFWLGVLLVAFANMSAIRRSGSLEGRSHLPLSNPKTLPKHCVGTTGRPPDIFFLIFDARVSPQALRKKWQYSDTLLTNALRRRGFFVADSAQSNYNWTIQSLAASFGMDYLASPTSRPGTPGFRTDVMRRMDEAAFSHPLRECGYRFVNFGMFKVAGAPPSLHANGKSAAVTMLERTLAGPPLAYILGIRQGNWGLKYVLNGYNEAVVRRVSRFRPSGGPVFMYAHVIAPHSPFMFGADGSPLPVARRQPKPGPRFAAAYLDYLRFTDKWILQMVDSLTAHTPRPHVIVIQGDHGVREMEVYHDILSAIRLPDPEVTAAWPVTSPVNTFRHLYNRIFSSDYPILPDSVLSYGY